MSFIENMSIALTLAILPILGSPAFAAADKMFDYRDAAFDNGLRVITFEDFSAPHGHHVRKSTQRFGEHRYGMTAGAEVG